MPNKPNRNVVPKKRGNTHMMTLADRDTPRVGDHILYTPPWRPYNSHELEFGILEAISGQWAYVRYDGTSTPTKTHVANIRSVVPAHVPSKENVDKIVEHVRTMSTV